MHRLVVNPGTANAWEIPLSPGVLVLGRNPDNDVPIEHESVSSTHCQLRVTDADVRLKDLGSTGGTFVNDTLVEEAVLRPGQTVRLGDIVMRYESDAGPAPESAAGAGPAPLALNAPCKYHRHTRARFLCPHCHGTFCDLCTAIRQDRGQSRFFCRACGVECTPLRPASVERTPEPPFVRQALGAFKYPINEDGVVLLIGGGLFFLLLDAAKYPLRYALYFGGLFILGITLFGLGYLSAYLSRIVTGSADGEDRLPDWPEFTHLGDILSNFWQLFATVAFSFSPAIALSLYARMTTAAGAWLGWTTAAAVLLGGVYLPMAFLAVTMFDSVGALNPLLIVPSILRIPLEYLVTLLVLAGILCVGGAGEIFRRRLLPIPILPSLLTSLLGLYGLTVEMRILGLLYRARQDELGWFKRY